MLRMVNNDSCMQSDLFSAFKAYDVRARSPEVLDVDFAFKLGVAVKRALNPKNVMVGLDMRTTSPELESSLIESLTSQGINVVRIGLCSTPMFNILLGLAKVKFDLGIMITASHNPAQYNGFKITHGNCLPLGLGSGLETIRDAWPGPDFAIESAAVRGEVADDPEALDKYVDYVLKLADLPADMPDLRVVIDAGNGMAGHVLPKLLAKCPWIKSDNLYFELDGNFPNHEANPIKTETLEALRAKVLENGAVCGVAFDGDADRVGFLDENGEQIRGDVMTALLADMILKKKGPGLILADIRSSWSVNQAVERAGGQTEFCKVGHANIKQDMKNKNALFAGEMSMHYYFQELWNVESGDYAMLLLLKALAESGRSLSSSWREFVHYRHSGEINLEVADASVVFKRVQEVYADKADKSYDLDGLRYEFGDPKSGNSAWWFNLRASNTEPLIRLNLEATTDELMAEKLAEVTSLIKIIN